jgi:predicted transcriptional regulator
MNQSTKARKKSKKKTSTTKKSAELQMKKKWGADTYKAGFTQVPSILVEKQHALGINNTQLVVLLNLMKYWWRSESMPFPSVTRIANSMDMRRNSVQKALAKLEDYGLIERISRYHSDNQGQTSNEYSLKGLVEKLSEYSKNSNELKELQKVEMKAQSASKK